MISVKKLSQALLTEAYPSRLAWFFRSSDRLKKSESKGLDTFECGNLNILVHSANNFVVLRVLYSNDYSDSFERGRPGSKAAL